MKGFDLLGWHVRPLSSGKAQQRCSLEVVVAMEHIFDDRASSNEPEKKMNSYVKASGPCHGSIDPLFT